MTITMYQSDRNFVTPANDASLYAGVSGDSSGVLRRGNMLNITVNGLTVTVGTGQAIVLGRLIEVTEPTTFTIPGSSSGNIVIAIDLSKANTVVGQAGMPNYQVKVNQVYLAGVTGNLIQEDINNGGFVYQLPLATFTTTATTATIKQHNPMLNDTGWLNLDTARAGSRIVSSTGFAQFRVRDNVVFVRWRNVDITNSVRRNQVGFVPRQYAPDVEIAGAGTNIDDANFSHASVNTAVMEPDGLLWINYGDNQINNLHGSLSYPI